MSPEPLPEPFGLFEVFGIELEYMIVDRDRLAVRPIADQLFRAATGQLVGDHEDGAIAWSNELVLHVVELKTNGPASSLVGLADRFRASAARVDALLADFGARLLPTGMHPTMDPFVEAQLWRHEHSPVYEAYDRIFDCRGHGWSNLQSCHLNLPFSGDEEFGALHLAVRAILPLLPALSASTPFRDGVFTGFLDTRLEVYRNNQRAVPCIVGQVVPEPVTSRAQYHAEILEPIWADIAPHDHEGVLRHEWLNSRGAIARFDRSAIEIRVLDMQESPVCDLAVCALVVEALRALTEERWCTLADLATIETDGLGDLFLRVVKDGERTPVEHPELVRCLGAPAGANAGDVWRHLSKAVLGDGDVFDAPLRDALHVILDRGPLARRLLAAVGSEPQRESLHELYRRLADCLVPGDSPVFVPD